MATGHGPWTIPRPRSDRRRRSRPVHVPRSILIDDVIRHLSQGIGVRFAGTPAEEAGARYIQPQFQALGLESRLDYFSFLGWRLLSEPVLELGAQGRTAVPCFALVYSPPTPPEGVCLPIVRIGKTTLLRGIDCEKFALVDPETGIHRAHVIARLDGPGCAMTLVDPVRAIPTVLVGGQEALTLQQQVATSTGLMARLMLGSEISQQAMSCNVLARLPGRSTDRAVLVTAHHDTQYNSPGAVDNASGIEGLLALAERMRRVRSTKAIQFAAFGAEEYMLVGSRHHAQLLEETGRLGGIDAVVNLDMIACNEPTWSKLTEDDLDLKVRVARVFERLGVFQRFGDVHGQTPPWPTSDHAPFTEAGVPTLFISYRGQRYPHLHLPTDTPDKVDRSLFSLSVDCVQAIVEDLAR